MIVSQLRPLRYVAARMLAVVETTMSFSDVLRGLRKSRGMSRAELATAVGLSQAHVSQLETGKQAPSPERIGKIAALFGIALDSSSQVTDVAQASLPGLDAAPAASKASPTWATAIGGERIGRIGRGGSARGRQRAPQAAHGQAGGLDADAETTAGAAARPADARHRRQRRASRPRATPRTVSRLAAGKDSEGVGGRNIGGSPR